MKRKLQLGGCLVLLIIFAAFVVYILALFRPPRPFETPYGTWRSHHPYITFTIVSRSVSYNHGIYRKNEANIDIIVSFRATFKEISIHNRNALREDGRLDVTHSYFRGGFEVVDDRMYYRLFPRTQERTGYETIIFERVAD